MGTSPTIVSIGSNISNKPGDVLTTQNGVNVAEARFAYDSKGNLLTTYKWNGSAWLSNTTPNSYNSNGTIANSYDLANNQTIYAYMSDNYISCSSCSNFPFPTSITNVKTGLTKSSTWNGIGGVKLTDTDANKNATIYGYTACVGGAADPFWRVTSTTDPLGNEVCIRYPTGSSPDATSTSFTFNSGNSIHGTTTTTDGYGRTIDVQKAQSPNPTVYDTVSTEYLWSGNYREVQTKHFRSAKFVFCHRSS